MKRVDQVAAALRHAGEATRIVRAPVPELVDDEVALEGGLHVQVGEACLILVRINPDGTFTFFPEAESFDHLLRQIAEARESGDGSAAPEGGADSATSTPGGPIADAVDRWLGAAAEVFRTPPTAQAFASDELPSGDEAVSKGAVLYPSPVDGADYALLAPGSDRRGYSVLRFDDAGAALVVAVSITEAGANDLLAGYLDGTHQASAERYFEWLAQVEAAVRPTVARPLRAAGYTVYNTGGNCLAWMRVLPDAGEASYVLISTDDGLDGNPRARQWLVGRWDGDGWINVFECFTLAGAIRAAARLPPAVDRHGQPVEEVYETLSDALAALGVEAPDRDG